MAEDRRIIHEITPLMGKDVLYIADRHKKEFTYPYDAGGKERTLFFDEGNHESVWSVRYIE